MQFDYDLITPLRSSFGFVWSSTGSRMVQVGRGLNRYNPRSCSLATLVTTPVLDVGLEGRDALEVTEFLRFARCVRENCARHYA